MPIFLTLWSLIKRAKPLHIALVAALAFGALQSVKLGIERRHATKLQERVNEVVAELSRITDARNRQAERTIETIKQADQERKQAEPIARRIETAPIEPGCKTPASILGADL